MGSIEKAGAGRAGSGEKNRRARKGERHLALDKQISC